MKISTICLAGLSAANEKKVPPRHPLQRLNRLVQFTEEILDSGYFDKYKSKRWIGDWKRKFATNAGRMEKNFNRVKKRGKQRGKQQCGFYDGNL